MGSSESSIWCGGSTAPARPSADGSLRKRGCITATERCVRPKETRPTRTGLVALTLLLASACADHRSATEPTDTEPPPAISPSPISLTFAATEGESNPPSQVIQIANSGGDTLAWSVAAEQSWVTLTPASGTATTETDEVTVGISTAGLASGTHTATIAITAPNATNSPQTIAITLELAEPPPEISHAPTALTFTAVEGGGVPAGQTLQIANSGGDTLAWSMAADQSWMTLTPARGTATTETDAVTVAVNTAGLASGTYTATITITAPNATNSPQTATVTLRVTGPDPLISRSPTSLTFAALVGGSDPASQTLQIANSGGDTLAWSVAADQSWVTLTPASGTATTETDEVTVGIGTAGLANGTHTATISITAPNATNSPQTIAINLELAEAPPTITLTPASLGFSAVERGDNPPSQPLQISNGGGGTLSWTADVDQGWLSLTPITGSSTGDTNEVTIGVNTTGLSSGTYTATITIAAVGATNTPLTTGVTLDLAAVWPTNGWIQATPASMGLSEDKLLEARDYAINTSGGGGSGIITRSGRSVLTWGDIHQSYTAWSITKSIGSMILGLAIKDGLMDLSDLAQQHHSSIGTPPQSNVDTGWLDDITILNLATQTAGFPGGAGYEPLLYEPGTAWYYSEGGPNWLAEAITLAYGSDLLAVLSSRIMANLGIPTDQYSWRANRYRATQIGGVASREFGTGIETNVDALARIGHLYLRNGEWDGTEILPASYVTTAAAPVAGVRGLPSLDSLQFPYATQHHGLLWWNNANGVMPSIPRDAYFAWGYSEGFIIVLPSHDIVVARLGEPWRVDTEDPVFPVLEPFLSSVVESVVVP